MKILIVDDSAMMRKLLRRELECDDYDVFEAVDGIDALEQISTVQPDLITMDVDMPRLDGFETVEKIRQELNYQPSGSDCPVPIVFITANDTLEGRSRGFAVGAAEFLTKPFVTGEVRSTVDALLSTTDDLTGTTALIVEDSPVSQHILELILNREGIQTVITRNGLEAFELMKEKGNDIDIIITDFMMPLMNGDELCRRIRRDLEYKAIPVIFLSALNERDSILKMFASGASDYIVKPFAKEELLARIRVHLETRLLSRQLARQVRDLKRLNKLKDDFLAITSHDLKAPLNGILGFTDILLEEAPLGEDHREYLEHVKNSGEFLLTLIGDILDLGRLQSEAEELKMETLDLAALLRGTMETLKHMASPKNIQLQLNCPDDTDFLIQGNRNALIRIFNNLLSNAIKFTKNKGEVRVILEKTAGYIQVAVEDNGIGIHPEKIPQLFDKFSKFSRPGTAGEKGTGLGLSITRELVERHNGQLQVDSQEGQGSVFRIRLPALSEPSQQPHSGTAIAPLEDVGDDVSVESVLLLIVDDNQLNLKLGKTIFEKKGYQVILAENGQQALELYKKSLGNNSNVRVPDLIFMDIHMPLMNGIETTREIRSFEKGLEVAAVPIIAMTADSSARETGDARNAGIDGFVEKPMNVKQMEEVIKKFIIIDK